MYGWPITRYVTWRTGTLRFKKWHLMFIIYEWAIFHRCAKSPEGLSVNICKHCDCPKKYGDLPEGIS